MPQGDGAQGSLARIEARHAAGGRPGRQGMHLPPLCVLIQVGAMKMAGKNGMGPIAKTGLGKSGNLCTRQPAAKGRIGVFETTLEVLDQGRSQGEVGQKQFGAAVLAEFAKGQVTDVQRVDLVTVAKQMSVAIQMPGAGGTPGKGLGVALA